MGARRAAPLVRDAQNPTIIGGLAMQYSTHPRRLLRLQGAITWVAGQYPGGSDFWAVPAVQDGKTL